MRDAMLDDLARCTGLDVTVVWAETGTPPRHGSPLLAPGGESAESLLTRISPRFDQVWVVAPESGGTLGRLQAAVGDARWLGCAAPAIHIAGSKVATRKRLAASGIEVPAGYCGHPERPCQWVVKPDDGVGAQHVRRHRDSDSALADLSARQDGGQAASLEEWIPGEALSLSVIVRAGQCELVSINRQRVVTDESGVVRYLGVDRAVEALRTSGARAMSALAQKVTDAVEGLNGFVGIDLVRTTSGRLVVIEINPRLTCAYVGLSARIGRNLAAQMLTPVDATHRSPALACA